MERSIRLNFDLTLNYGPRTWRWVLLAVMMLMSTGELSSETVTLSTYYPAPSGVYVNMITTGDTRLARDAGNVAVGATTTLSKLGVKGGLAVGTYADTVAAPANGLIVSGNTGIGTSAPGSRLSVVGDVGVSAGNVAVSGGGGVIVSGGGGVSVSGGNVTVTSGYVRLSASGCAFYDVNEGIVCSGATYATFTPGLYTEGWTFQDRGGQVMIEKSGYWGTQVRGLDGSGNESWMTLRKLDGTTRIWCCPR